MVKRIILRTIGNTLIISSVLVIVLTWGPLLRDEIFYQWHKLVGQNYCLLKLSDDGKKCQPKEPVSAFGSLLGKVIRSDPIFIEPADKNFGLVIEAIGVNSPVVKNVSVTDPKAYNDALKGGVAHAAGSALPTDPRGNVYIFAHSSLNFWELGKYATVFNLLRKLEANDKIHLFYEGKDYIYMVIDKQTVAGFNTYPLERRTIEPILTLQTCDPPGTTINRLVVTAKLISVT